MDVAYHTSFAPEVTWGQQALAASLPGPGALLGAERQSVFEAHLACQRDGPPVDALLVTSWHVADPAKTTRLLRAPRPAALARLRESPRLRPLPHRP
jgi:hypothetical protein